MRDGTVASSDFTQPSPPVLRGRGRRVIEALRDRIFPVRRAEARRLAEVAFSIEDGSTASSADTHVKPNGNSVEAHHGGKGPNGNGPHEMSAAELLKRYPDLWVTPDPFNTERARLDVLQNSRPKWVRDRYEAERRPPSDWYIGPLGPDIIDAVHATTADFEDLVKLERMNTFDSERRAIITQRVDALAKGQRLTPAEMKAEEDQLIAKVQEQDQDLIDERKQPDVDPLADAAATDRPPPSR